MRRNEPPSRSWSETFRSLNCTVGRTLGFCTVGFWAIGDHLPNTESTTPSDDGKPSRISSPLPAHQPCAMSISIPAFLSYLLLLGSAHAQVSAPNCTDNNFAWVGSSFRRPFRIDIDTSFASFWCLYRHSTLSNKILAGSWRTWGRHVTTAVSRCTFGASQTILSACVAFSVPILPPEESYSGPSGTETGDTACKCNTVVYNLISACDACQGETWTPCVDRLRFCLHSNRLVYSFTQLL